MRIPKTKRQKVRKGCKKNGSGKVTLAHRINMTKINSLNLKHMNTDDFIVCYVIPGSSNQLCVV